MKNKEELIEMFSTLFFSWGSDAPAEVFWAANELLEWINKEFDVTIVARFNEEDDESYDVVIDEIKNL